MILVTGATGRTGSSTVRALAKRGVAVRAMVRSQARADALALEGVEIAAGDFDDAARIAELCRAVDTLVVISPNGPRQKAIETSMIDCAISAGARRIVKLSSMEAVPNAPNPVHAAHFDVEQHLRASNVEWTIVRTSFFMQNLLGPAKRIKEEGVLSLPTGHGKVTMTDAIDVGECLAQICTDGTHARRSYDVTGAELLSFEQIAQRLSRQLDKPVTYEPQDPATYGERLSRIIPSAWHVEAVCGIFEEIRNGYFVEPTRDFEKLCKRPPTSLEGFAARHAALFGAPG